MHGLALSVALVAGAPGASPAPEAPGHVVLVSIDGMRGDYLWDEERYQLKIPNLRKLVSRGSFAEAAVGVTPSLTYPSHASIVTGMFPARHGILANERFQPERWRAGEDGYGRQDGFWEASHFRAKTLWEAAREKGLSTAAFSWPSTLGAAIDWLFLNPPASYRRGVEDRRSLVAEVSTSSLVESFERDFGRLPGADARLRDHYLALMAARVLREEKPNLLLIHFGLADGRQHEHGAASIEGLAAVEDVDQNVGILMEAVEEAGIAEETAFIITGDHGHLPLHTQIGANIPLVESGHIRLDEEGRISTWLALVHAARPFASVYVKHRPKRVEATFLKLAEDYGGIFRVLPRDELGRLGADPDASFALEAAVGFTFDDRLSGDFLVPHGRKSGHGWTPATPGMETTFLASGPGIRRGLRLPEVRLVDVAPTVARLLGLELPGTDGRPIVSLLDEAAR